MLTVFVFHIVYNFLFVKQKRNLCLINFLSDQDFSTLQCQIWSLLRIGLQVYQSFKYFKLYPSYQGYLDLSLSNLPSDLTIAESIVASLSLWPLGFFTKTSPKFVRALQFHAGCWPGKQPSKRENIQRISLHIVLDSAGVSYQA